MPQPHPRLWIGRVLAGLLLPLLMATLLMARPQKEDEDPKAKPKKQVPKEDEDPKAKPKKAVPKDDDGKPVKPVPKDDGPKKPIKPLDEDKIDLAAEAAKTNHPAARKLFTELTHPHDVLTLKSQGKITAVPVSVYVGERPNTTKVPYTPMSAPGRPDKLSTSAGTGELLEVRHFEMIAINKVNAFLSDGLQWVNANKSDPNYMSRLDQLVVADKALTFVQRFHDAAKTDLKRQGAGWDALRKNLMDHLLTVLEDELAALDAASATNKEYAIKAGDLAYRIAESYADSPQAQRTVAVWKLNQAKNDLSERDDIYITGAETLRNLERRFPTVDPKVFDTLRDKLRRRSEAHLDEARRLATNPDNTFLAQRQVEWCELIDPSIDGLQAFKTKLNRDYRVLVVGVRQLPDRMSPALALTDADRWAIELVFESLIKPVPDPEVGQRYRAELAARPPKLIPMGREFQMLPNAAWATREGDGEKITAFTVKDTIVQMQKLPKLPFTERVGMFPAPNVTDPFQFKLYMDRTYIEPLAAMSFKVLPTQILDKKPDGLLDKEFAANPIGSGPYVYFGRRTEDGKEFAVFKANRSYGSRPGRTAPKIQEIRFVVTPPDPAVDLREGKLDLLLDVPTAELMRLRSPDLRLANAVTEQTLPTRRIWMLAVNHRQPELGGEVGKNLRRAIAHAIDRDEILKTFRAGTLNHRPLTGPFPPDVWATPTSPPPPQLFRAEYAQSMIKQAKKPDRLTLKFVNDPLSLKACEAIKQQITSLGLGLNIELAPLAPDAFDQAVMVEHAFDLAYIPFDYNEVYSLTGLFDPEATGRQERNFMGYLPDANISRWLNETRATRSFNKVRDNSHLLHGAFNETMPFIPLWQLDFHLIVSQKLEVHPLKEYLNPLTIFDQAETWRLNR